MTSDEEIRMIASMRTHILQEGFALGALGRESKAEAQLTEASRLLQEAKERLNEAVALLGGRP